MKPEEMLGENQNERVIRGVTVRKGIIGAFLANCRMIKDTSLSAAARSEARPDLLDLIPAVAAVGFLDAFAAKDPELEALIQQGLSMTQGSSRTSP